MTTIIFAKYFCFKKDINISIVSNLKYHVCIDIKLFQYVYVKMFFHLHM